MLLEATLLRAVNEALFFVQPAVLAVLVFSIYHLLGNMLKPHEVRETFQLELNRVVSLLSLLLFLYSERCIPSIVCYSCFRGATSGVFRYKYLTYALCR